MPRLAATTTANIVEVASGMFFRDVFPLRGFDYVDALLDDTRALPPRTTTMRRSSTHRWATSTASSPQCANRAGVL